MSYKDPEKRKTKQRDAARKRRLDPEYRKKQAAWMKGRYSSDTAHKARVKEAYLLREYGLTTEKWNTIFELQGHCCAICGTGTPGPKGFWHTDHCHTSGLVRGILCHNCNLLLGYAKDSEKTLTTAIEYLRLSHG